MSRSATAFLLVCCLFIFINCNDSVNEQHAKQTAEDTSLFFPVHDYFLQQIHTVDSLNAFKKIITKNNSGEQTSDLSTFEFKSLAANFIEVNIAAPEIKKYYIENIFFDASTNSYAFNYTSKNKDLPVESIDVLLDPATQIVKRIFINKSYISADTIITEKLGWKHNENFTIHVYKKVNDSIVETQQKTILWNNF